MFNFLENYQSYSNIDLLKIVKRPNKYQPEAVAAAETILETRSVTEEELNIVAAYYTELDSQEKKSNEKIQQVINQTNDFLKPILQPSEKVNSTKWLNIIIFIVTLQYIREYIKVLAELKYMFTVNNYNWDSYSYFIIILLVYIPIVIYLLWKRKKWGWILLFSTTIFSVISQVIRIMLYAKYNDMFTFDPFEVIIPVSINIALIYVLYKNNIAQAFQVNQKSKKEIAIIVIIGTLMFSWLVNELYY